MALTGLALKMFGSTIKKAAPAVIPVAGTGIAWGTAAIGSVVGALGISLLGGGGTKKAGDATTGPQDLNQDLVQLLKQQQEQNAALALSASMPIAPIITQPQHTTIHTTTNTYDYSTLANTITDSPFASIDSKKTMSGAASATASGSWTTPTSGSQDLSGSLSQVSDMLAKMQASQEGAQKASAEGGGIGTDLLPIAIIAAVGIIGYGYVSKRK